jgi:hypothetical protein
MTLSVQVMEPSTLTSWKVRATPRRAIGGFERVDGLAVEYDLAAVDGQGARDQVHGRGLARAIGAEQTHDLARVDVKAQFVDGHQAAEALVAPRTESRVAVFMAGLPFVEQPSTPDRPWE